LHAGDELGVLGIDPAVDAPIEIPRDPHLAAAIGERVADLANYGLRRAHRQELHEINLVGVDVEGDIRKELVIEPLALVARRQVVDLRQEALVGAL